MASLKFPALPVRQAGVPPIRYLVAASAGAAHRVKRPERAKVQMVPGTTNRCQAPCRRLGPSFRIPHSAVLHATLLDPPPVRYSQKLTAPSAHAKLLCRG